ncbi:hypothetical protein [Bacteroides sp.]|uniref:hypothetical protein n=1 Tax=Bacteroides sp. TaxID=29523 RepID=UPI00262A7DE4|nr:hypothetical protein [Bacteroides sp.]
MRNNIAPKETLEQLLNGSRQSKLKRMIKELREIKDAMDTNEFKYICFVARTSPLVARDLSNVSFFPSQISSAISVLEKLASIAPKQSEVDVANPTTL